MFKGYRSWYNMVDVPWMGMLYGSLVAIRIVAKSLRCCPCHTFFATLLHRLLLYNPTSAKSPFSQQPALFAITHTRRISNIYLRSNVRCQYRQQSLQQVLRQIPKTILIYINKSYFFMLFNWLLFNIYLLINTNTQW